MIKGMELVGLVVAGMLLLAPLGYGLSTLWKMKHKSLYPLLRLKRRDGTTLGVKVDACGPLQNMPRTERRAVLNH